MLEQLPTCTPVQRKRSHDEAEGLLTSPMSTGISTEIHLVASTSSPALNILHAAGRQLSPAISIDSSVLSDTKNLTSSAIPATSSPSAGPARGKKQKLTFAEKEVERAKKQSEKEAREKRQVEEAERRQREKLARDDEKRRREEEKEAIRRLRELEKSERLKAKDAERQARDDAKRKKEVEKRAKDAEKQAKEDAKRSKEEEMKKKERCQLRLGSFFPKPVAGEGSEGSSYTSSRRSSVVSLGGTGDVEEVTTKVSPQKKPEAKYGFLPFFVPKYVKLAPTNRFVKDTNLINMAASRLDRWMKQERHLHLEDLRSSFNSSKRKRSQKRRYTIKEIIDTIQGSLTSPIDLTGDVTSPPLSDVSYKILSFREDVRPPYTGTYTRAVSPKSASKLSRCPFARQLPDTDYDYDSEAEWEPPNEDDEDLKSGDDESDIGDEGDEDMDGFLDDEDDLGRRKQIVGEMVPINSGLCWLSTIDEKGPLDEYRIQPLSDDITFPIDPFSTAYWSKSQLPAKQQPQMQPPRLPLSSLNPNRSLSMTPPSVKGEGEVQSHEPSQKPDAPLETRVTAAAKLLKLAPDEVLPAFKQAVEGSELTKAGMIEVLKKQCVIHRKPAAGTTLLTY